MSEMEVIFPDNVKTKFEEEYGKYMWGIRLDVPKIEEFMSCPLETTNYKFVWFYSNDGFNDETSTEIEDDAEEGGLNFIDWKTFTHSTTEKEKDIQICVEEDENVYEVDEYHQFYSFNIYDELNSLIEESKVHEDIKYTVKSKVIRNQKNVAAKEKKIFENVKKGKYNRQKNKVSFNAIREDKLLDIEVKKEDGFGKLFDKVQLFGELNPKTRRFFQQAMIEGSKAYRSKIQLVKAVRILKNLIGGDPHKCDLNDCLVCKLTVDLARSQSRIKTLDKLIREKKDIFLDFMMLRQKELAIIKKTTNVSFGKIKKQSIPWEMLKNYRDDFAVYYMGMWHTLSSRNMSSDDCWTKVQNVKRTKKTSKEEKKSKIFSRWEIRKNICEFSFVEAQTRKVKKLIIENMEDKEKRMYDFFMKNYLSAIQNEAEKIRSQLKFGTYKHETITYKNKTTVDIFERINEYKHLQYVKQKSERDNKKFLTWEEKRDLWQKRRQELEKKWNDNREIWLERLLMNKAKKLAKINNFNENFIITQKGGINFIKQKPIETTMINNLHYDLCWNGSNTDLVEKENFNIDHWDKEHQQSLCGLLDYGDDVCWVDDVNFTISRNGVKFKAHMITTKKGPIFACAAHSNPRHKLNWTKDLILWRKKEGFCENLFDEYVCNMQNNQIEVKDSRDIRYGDSGMIFLTEDNKYFVVSGFFDNTFETLVNGLSDDSVNLTQIPCNLDKVEIDSMHSVNNVHKGDFFVYPDILSTVKLEKITDTVLIDDVVFKLNYSEKMFVFSAFDGKLQYGVFPNIFTEDTLESGTMIYNDKGDICSIITVRNGPYYAVVHAAESLEIDLPIPLKIEFKGKKVTIRRITQEDLIIDSDMVFKIYCNGRDQNIMFLDNQQSLDEEVPYESVYPGFVSDIMLHPPMDGKVFLNRNAYKL